MKILDSSVIIAFFRRNESLHESAVDIFMQKEKFLVLDYVLAEVLTVLKLREGFDVAKDCAEFLNNVSDVEIFHTNADVFNAASDFFVRNRNQLSFIDTLLLTFARSEKFELVTFDKELKKMGSS